MQQDFDEIEHLINNAKCTQILCHFEKGSDTMKCPCNSMFSLYTYFLQQNRLNSTMPMQFCGVHVFIDLT